MTSYLISIKSEPSASAQIIFFPYAGASASVYSLLGRKMPDSVSVSAVELPGHGTRLKEAPHENMQEMIDALREALHPAINLPTILCGHSMGAILAREIAQSALEANRPVSGLAATACAAPHLPVRRSKKLATLPTGKLLVELDRLGGLPKPFLANRELLELFLPSIRADLKCRESWQSPAKALPLPITVFSGMCDNLVAESDLAEWRYHTSMPLSMHAISGGHFFIHTERETVAEHLSQLATSAC